MPDWYYIKDGAQVGPFSEDVFLKMLAEGSINRATKVWREGFPEWTTLGATDLVPRTNATLPPPSSYYQPNKQYGSDSAFGRQVLRPFSDLAGFTNGLSLMFYLATGMACIAMVSYAWQYRLIHTVNFAELEPAALNDIVTSNDNRQALIAIVQLILHISTGIALLVWINHAAKNLRSLGAERLRFSPDWAVGWWFIPVLSLVRPYQIMVELSKASANPSGWEGERHDKRIGWWWGLFLIMNFFNAASYRALERANDIPGIEFATILALLGNIAAIWSALLAAKIIGTIWADQRASRYGRGAAVTAMAVARR